LKPREWFGAKGNCFSARFSEVSGCIQEIHRLGIHVVTLILSPGFEEVLSGSEC